MLDSQGRTICGNTANGSIASARDFSAAGKNRRRAIRSRKDYRTEPKLFSLVAFNEESGGQLYTLQVAQDRSSDEQVERNFALLFIAVLFGGVAGLGFDCDHRYPTRVAAAPGNDASHSAESGQTQLKERIGSAGWPRELQPLAIAFDEMLKRLDDSFTRLSQFSADLAHELRTPIANMLGEAQVALTRDRTAADYRETHRIHRCRMRTAFQNRGQFAFCRARGCSARTDRARKRFDARAAVGKIAAFYQTVADDHHVTITLQRRRTNLCRPDSVRTRRGKSARQRAAIHSRARFNSIALSKHNSDFEVAVSDNGCGIAARTFAARVRSILPCRIIAQFRWSRPRSGAGEIDCRSPRRLSRHREQRRSWHNGQMIFPLA